MTSFYYYNQNPSGFRFLMHIRAFVFETSLGNAKLEYERKNKKDSGRSSKVTPSRKGPINKCIEGLSIKKRRNERKIC